MDISELDYELPPELIAQDPAERRDASRLLVYERGTGAVRHRTFDELPEELQGELVVVNDTKVVPARIPIESPRGELLLLERLDDGTWEALARPTRRARPRRPYWPPPPRGGGGPRVADWAPPGCWSIRARGGGVSVWRASLRARRRCRRTSRSRWPIPRATRPSMRARWARLPRRPPACTSRPSSSRGSSTSASRSTSASTRSGRS